MSRVAMLFRTTTEPISSRLLRFVLVGAILCILFMGIAIPVYTLLRTSIHDKLGHFVGLANFTTYLQTPGLQDALLHTLVMGAAVTLTTLCLAFCLAYAFTHTCMRGRSSCRLLSMLILFVPSLFPALGLIYLLGSQGLLADLVEDIPLYGPLGVFLGLVIYTLPHATLLLTAALRDIRADLYTAAALLGASALRRFLTVTIPSIRYGLTSATIVVFILSITDFGIPKVLGGSYNMLATEIYVQATGLQNFPMASVVSLVLLAPALFAFYLDRRAYKRQHSKQDGTAVQPSPHTWRDAIWTLVAWAICLLPCAIISIVGIGACVQFWPYDLSFTLSNFSFHDSPYGLSPFINSIRLATACAVIGTALIFCASYITIRTQLPAWLTASYRFFALLPLGIPGSVLGLAFILAFNSPQSFWGRLPDGMFLLIFNTIIHLYTVCHLTLSRGLLVLPSAYEQAGASLGAGTARTLGKVIIPLQAVSLRETALYIFVNAMTTVSAVVFLYTPDTMPASVAILHMLELGRMAEASAMGCLILLTALGAHLLVKLCLMCIPVYKRHTRTTTPKIRAIG